MRNSDILRKHLERCGRHLKQGETECFTPILHFLILDVMYQLYCRTIRPMEVKRDAKKAKKEWMKSYHLFNADFFAAFDADETEYITDRMDSLEAFIRKDMLVAEVQIHNECMFLPVEERKIVSAIILCGVLAQAAECVYEDTHTNGGRIAENPHIKNIIRNINIFRVNYRVSTGDDIDVRVSDSVVKSVEILCRRMVDWCYDGDENYKN